MITDHIYIYTSWLLAKNEKKKQLLSANLFITSKPYILHPNNVHPYPSLAPSPWVFLASPSQLYGPFPLCLFPAHAHAPSPFPFHAHAHARAFAPYLYFWSAPVCDPCRDALCGLLICK